MLFLIPELALAATKIFAMYKFTRSMMKTTLQRRAFFIALFVYFNYCHYMLMTTIPFSYPPKWVIADLYLYRAVLSSNFEDLNNNNDLTPSR